MAMQDVLPYVSSGITSLTYAEPAPNATKQIDLAHLYEELVTFV